MVSALISRLIFLGAGTLYPAYRSFKAVRTKDVREYVKWMMYWVVFAVFICIEALMDVFVAFWLPFYYELKILFVLWLLLPYTKGASMLYRKFIHPTLVKHEKEIDQYMDQAKTEGYRTVMRLGSQGILYAREIVTSVAMKGQEHLVHQMRKTQSLNDISRGDEDLPVGGLDRRAIDSRRTISAAGPRIEEIREEEEDFADGGERVWSGYYGPDGRFVEAEEGEGGPMAPQRRAGRKSLGPDYSNIDGYATLPRSTRTGRRY